MCGGRGGRKHMTILIEDSVMSTPLPFGKILHLCRKLLGERLVDRADEELCMNPEGHSMHASHPRGQWPQATAIAGQSAETPFDLRAARVELRGERRTTF